MREQKQKKPIVICKYLLKKMCLLNFALFISYLFTLIKRHYQLCVIKRKWEYMNPHNDTRVANTIYDCKFPLDKVKVGVGSYGPLCIHYFKTQEEYLYVGNYCSIASGVEFILGGNHHMDHFTTYPFRAICKNKIEALTKGPIIVEDDVWIGTNAIILSGCTLGKGSVVAAGSVVTKSTPPFSIVGGNPAKVIRMRYREEIIQELLKFDFSGIRLPLSEENIDLLYQPVSSELLEKIRQEIFFDDCGGNERIQK